MRPLGKHQLRLLACIGSPFSLLIVGDKVADSLAKRGLAQARFQDKSPDGFYQITPEGLRVLADALEGGCIEPFFDPRYQSDRVRLMIDARGKAA